VNGTIGHGTASLVKFGASTTRLARVSKISRTNPCTSCVPCATAPSVRSRVFGDNILKCTIQYGTVLPPCYFSLLLCYNTFNSLRKPGRTYLGVGPLKKKQPVWKSELRTLFSHNIGHETTVANPLRGSVSIYISIYFFFLYVCLPVHVSMYLHIYLYISTFVYMHQLSPYRFETIVRGAFCL